MLGRTRTCGRLIRSQKRRVFICSPGSENRLVKLNLHIECFSMFAGVDPGNCQTSVSKKCLEPASCSCDGPGGKRRRRTSCLGDVFCLQDKVGTKQLCDRSTHSGQVRCPRSSASASANTSHPTDSRTPTRPSHWW